jgi:hypothetical protein
MPKVRKLKNNFFKILLNGPDHLKSPKFRPKMADGEIVIEKHHENSVVSKQHGS